jgi:hypothetical protein
MTIPNADKERLKTLVHEFLADPELRGQRTAYHDWEAMFATLCAAHGKFDFALVLEHFPELVRTASFMGHAGETIDWRLLMTNCALYWLLDIPLTHGGVSPSSEQQDRFEWLFFGTYDYNSQVPYEKCRYFPPSRLPRKIEKCIDENDGDALCAELAARKDRPSLLERATYTALADGKWSVFAALHREFDLPAVLDMERVFEFWRCMVLTDKNNYVPIYEFVLGKTEEGKAFLREWRDAENYPLHRMIIDRDADGRCVPVLFSRGLLFPEVQSYLLERGIPFDKPLTPFEGWEQVTFPLFARYFGEFAPDIEPLRKTAQQSDERRFFAKLQAAEFYSKHIAPRLDGHPVPAACPLR